MNKTIALFGATGRTGRIILDKALKNGYEVKALVRNPGSLQVNHPALQIIQGDILNYDKVLETIKSSDGIISVIGHVKDSPSDIQTKAMDYMVRAMKETGVHRIISLTGGGVPDPENDRPKFADKLIRGIMKMVAKAMLEDAMNHASRLKSSNTEWTIARGPRLTMDHPVGAYRVSSVGVNSGIKISRYDLADFILDEWREGRYIRKMPFVTA